MSVSDGDAEAWLRRRHTGKGCIPPVSASDRVIPMNREEYA